MPRTMTRFKQADIRRAMKGARDAGVSIQGVEISPCGTITLKVGAADAPKEDAASHLFNAWKGSQK